MPASGAIRLDVVGLRKRFGKLAAVDGVTFRNSGARIIGLVGPNGSGKTTVIRCLLGLLKPSDGTIQINGKTPASLHASGLRVGYMPQDEALYPDLSVTQNVAFFARVNRVPRKQRADLVARAIATVALTQRAGDRVNKLSGGMRRRVSLACTLVNEPQLLVLDEPTVGVDPELRASMWSEFRRLRQDGTLILLSTHYLGEAGNCDVVLFMRQGKIIAADTPARLLARTGARNLEDAFLRLIGKGGQRA